MNKNINHSKAAAAATPERKRKAHSEVKRSVVSPDKVLADKVRRAMSLQDLRKRTTLGIYSLKCDDGNFGVPFCAVSDHFALLAQKQLLPLSNCWKLGTVCLYDGKVVPVKPFVLLDDKVVDHE